jgi:hypothetical protein
VKKCFYLKVALPKGNFRFLKPVPMTFLFTNGGGELLQSLVIMLLTILLR